MAAKKTILNLLLVDDDHDELTIFGDAVKMISREINVRLVTVLRDLEATLKSFMPDLIFLDVNMPGMNGYDWLKILKKQSSNIPIIMYSTSTNRERVHQAIAEGAVIYLPKPLDFSDLVSSLRQVLAMDWNFPEKIRESYFSNGSYRHFTLCRRHPSYGHSI